MAHPATEGLAHKVAEAMTASEVDRKVAFDPLTILTVISVIVVVIKMFIECRKKPKEALATAKSPGLVERWRLRKVIRSAIDDDEAEKVLARAMETGLMEAARKLTIAELEQLFAETAKG